MVASVQFHILAGVTLTLSGVREIKTMPTSTGLASICLTIPLPLWRFGSWRELGLAILGPTNSWTRVAVCLIGCWSPHLGRLCTRGVLWRLSPG